jgi:hypothetical protein
VEQGALAVLHRWLVEATGEEQSSLLRSLLQVSRPHAATHSSCARRNIPPVPTKEGRPPLDTHRTPLAGMSNSLIRIKFADVPLKLEIALLAFLLGQVLALLPVHQTAATRVGSVAKTLLKLTHYFVPGMWPPRLLRLVFQPFFCDT